MAPPRPSGGIGAALRDARERQGLTLRQIAATTKISISVLEALEREDISRLPGGIFGRAFVRSYAQEVGLDPEEIIRRFIVQFPSDTVTAGHPTARPHEDREAADSAERAMWTMGRLLLASVPLVGLVLYVTGAGRSAPPVEPAAAATQEAARHEPSVAVVTPVAALQPPPAAAVAEVAGPMLVSIAASEACWVQVEVDGQVVLERELRPGERELFEVDQVLAITAGNAAALSIAVDGRDIRSIGGAGQVASFSMTRDTVKDFFAEP